MGQSREFELWRPGWKDAVRGFFLSQNFQGAMQLTTGILFVSLFVFVSALRFPSSCVAVLLYIVVAVTAAPDNHVGTRIFISGFMLGPMWLAITIGAIVSTVAKLMPSPEAHMAVLCVLGPLAIVPFAIVRVGTGHLYLWAMGMVSALYIGMPIIAGFPIHSVARLWMLVVYIIIAALVAMFAGSVLSMLVLPTLASHALEDEVALALRQLGHHLSAATSFVLRGQAADGPAGLLPGHLRGIHPLLVREAAPTALAPGLLETGPLGQSAVHDVYVALMDWFERQSRPPAAHSKLATSIVCCPTTAGSSGAGSMTDKSTFYGADAARLAAAVAAAAADSFIGWGDADLDDNDINSNKNNIGVTAGTTTAHVPASSKGEPQLSSNGDGPPDSRQSRSLRARQTSSSTAGEQQVDLQQHLGAAASTLSQLGSTTARNSKHSSGQLQSSLRLGSSKAAAAYVAVQLKRAASGAVAAAAATSPGRGHAADDSGLWQSVRRDALNGAGQGQGSGEGGPAGCGGSGFAGRSPERSALSPVPRIADTRQLLAHATMLLDAAAAEPGWLRGSERRFERQQWAAVIVQAQLLATRLSALDLVQRDHAALLQDVHGFSISGMQQLLQTVYASAAAALAMLSEQAGDRSGREQGCRAALTVLQGSEWRQGKQQLLLMLEDTLVRYCSALHAASADAPFVMPRAQWVRQLMFFILATSSVMDAVDSLAAAATAALAVPPRSSRKQDSASCTSKQQQQQQQKDAQLLPHALTGAAGETGGDVEAGLKVAAPAGASKQPHSLQQQHDDVLRLGNGSAGADATAEAHPVDQQPAAAAAAPAADASCGSKLLTRLSSSFARNTVWVSPWLPLAQNSVQFAHLRVALTKELPAMFSSREAFLRQVQGRRFRAGLKYWFVLSGVMLGTLLLLYFVPPAYRYAPNFGYSAAAVGMSDRVESTVHKVISWTASAVVGATLGWSLMMHPAVANNPVALAAVICCFCFAVGTLNRSKNTLVILYTLMTVASVVLCQYTPACCNDTGSTMMAVMRGGSVAAASLFAVAVQNLVWPWYTSSWALEQLGLAYQEAAELLAGMVCELYSDAHALIDKQQQQQQQQETAVAGAAGWDGGENDGAGQQLPKRLLMLNAGALRAQQQLQQQQQQHTSSAEVEEAAGGAADTDAATADTAARAVAAAATELRANRSVRFDASSLSSSLLEPSYLHSPAGVRHHHHQQQQQGLQGQVGGSKSPYISSRLTPDFTSSRAAALTLSDYAATKLKTQQLQEELRQRRQQRLLAAGPAAAPAAAAAGSPATPPASSPAVLQGRLLRPLVQVKISMLLDTTPWGSGMYATPPVVLRMLAAMFDVADALGALQLASSIKVAAVSGSWDWTLVHMSCAWNDVMLGVLRLADAMLAHVKRPSDATAAALLTKIQEVQHLRFEFFLRSRDLRRLLHIAAANDDALLTTGPPGTAPVDLQGHMRYSAAVYATGKVLDRMTTVARCALEAGGRV